MKPRSAAKPRMKQKAWSGTRWMIVSPWQKFEHTISIQRKNAWSLFAFAVHRDVERYKKQGYRAVKVEASFCPVTPTKRKRK